jgi:hypothetical protein
MAPAYDLVAVRALDANLSPGFAMAIGDAFTAQEVTAYEWAHLGYLCGIPFRGVAQVLEDVVQRVHGCVAAVAADVERQGVPRRVTHSITELAKAECARHQALAAQVRRFRQQDFE